MPWISFRIFFKIDTHVGSELISIPGDSPTNELYGVSSIRLVDILGDVMASIDANNGNTGNFLHQ